MILFFLCFTFVLGGSRIEIRGATPDVFYEYEVDCSDEYWQFNDPECLKDIDNEENTRVGDGIYPIMGPWSTWTGCDKTCEEGTQTRVRFCDKTDMCGDEKQNQERACNEKIRKIRSPWSEWSSCTSECKRYRQKVCKDDNPCGCKDLRRQEDCGGGMCRRCMANPTEWTDNTHHKDGCAEYGAEQWCNQDGEKGPKWPTEGDFASISFGHFENNGHNARQCPECGCIEN
ncbi:unnamed protein product [Oikopleura dioica]|uniref:Uncharacterized protein n=1 Tax=Oikopleura dioica TaxID=34765 RepID=E4XJF9_OIKDI|nr:unnamed protein product [Oikopleura dioica]CBY38901.1 unnamed protein product [Oikopleura dioica]